MFFLSKKAEPKPQKIDNAQRVFLNDGLVNFITGLGTDSSKRTHGMWAYEGLQSSWREYEAAYQSSGIVRRVIDTIPDDALREWREIKTKSDIQAILSEEDRVGYRNAVRDATRWARLYGGAGLIMLTDQPLDRPLNVNAIGKGSLNGFVVLDRWYFGANSIQSFDITIQDFMLPEYFMVAGSESFRIHKSHIVRFGGCPLPPRLRIANFGWGDSVLRQVMQSIEDLLSANGGVAEALQQFNVDIVKRDGLFTDITTDQESSIIKRFKAFSMMKSVFHTAVLDGSEDLQRKELNFSGVDNMLRQLMHMVCACTHIPFTRLYGTSASGLNATGEGDQKEYNDYLRTLLNTDIDPVLAQIDRVLVRSALGHYPEDFSYEWKPLSTPSPIEKAQANLTQAQADAIYLENQVITASQVMRNLSASEAYKFDGKRIDEIEKIEQDDDLESIYGKGEGLEDDPDAQGMGKEAKESESADHGTDGVPPIPDKGDKAD